MSTLAQYVTLLAAFNLVFFSAISAYTYPLGVQIYTGCTPYEDFLGDYYDCKRFYRCSNGWKSSLYCPDGTVYDQSIRTCVNSPNGACIKYSSSPYGSNLNDYISYNGFTNYNNKPNNYNDYTAKSQALEKCPYTLSTLEKLVFCSLTSFRQLNAKCCV